MRCENIKIVILLVLVVISFVLIWGIWMFQFNFLEGMVLIKLIVWEKYKIDKMS